MYIPRIWIKIKEGIIKRRRIKIMYITWSKKNKLERVHQSLTNKRWFRNMDNRILNYLHIGEDNHMRWIHMDHKCRIDRVGVYPYLGKW